MLVRFFNNTRPITLLVLFVALAIIASSSVYISFHDVDYQNIYVSTFFYESIGAVSTYILSVGFILSLGFLLNFIAHDNSITKDNSFALLFFVILVFSSRSSSIINPVLISVLFLNLGLKNLLSLHEHNNASQKLFNTGLLLGISSVIYPFTIFYAILVFLGIVMYGADSWRQWITPILGIVLPYYILFSWFFWFDSLDYFWDTYFLNTLHFHTASFQASPLASVVWGIFALLIFLSLINFFQNRGSQRPDVRKGYLMAYLSLIIGVFITLVGTVKNGQELIILFLPMSIIWAKYIQHKKKDIYKSIFIIITLLSSTLSFFFG